MASEKSPTEITMEKIRAEWEAPLRAEIASLEHALITLRTMEAEYGWQEKKRLGTELKHLAMHAAADHESWEEAERQLEEHRTMLRDVRIERDVLRDTLSKALNMLGRWQAAWGEACADGGSVDSLHAMDDETLEFRLKHESV